MGEAKRRAAEIAALKALTSEEAYEANKAELERVMSEQATKAFTAGVQAAALCMRAVLARKIDIGLITEEVARSIFESTGTELVEAVEKAVG